MFGGGIQGETQLMSEREDITHPLDDESVPEPAVKRGADDRRRRVRPSDDPAPTSPAADAAAVRTGEEVLDRVKPY
jgi:hypothetical protein